MSARRGRATWLLAVLGVGGVAVVAAAAAAAGIVPGLARQAVQSALEGVVADALDADLSYGDIAVSLWSDFPAVSVQVRDVAVTGRPPFEGVTLVSLERLEVAVDVPSLLGDEPIVRSVELDGPRIDLRVREDARRNWSSADGAAAPATADEPSSMRLRLETLRITALELAYQDLAGGVEAKVEGLDLTQRGTFSATRADTRVEVQIASLSASAAGVDALVRTRWDATVDAVIGLADGSVEVREGRLRLNELPLTFGGSVVPEPEGLRLAVTWSAADSSFRDLLSLVPSAYLQGYEALQADGMVAASGSVTGLYASEGDHLPAFDLQLTARDAWLQYPELPERISDIALDLRVEHPEGAVDGTVIDLARLHLVAGRAPVDLRVSVRNPVSDPLLDAEVIGRIDLGALGDALAGLDATGVIDADFAVRGRMSDFEAQRVDAVSARGGVRASGLVLEGDFPDPVHIDALDLRFTPARADLVALELRTGATDLGIHGSLDNLWPYWLAERPLVGDLTLRADRIDLRPFQTEEEGTADDQAMGVLPVPTDLDLTIRGKADRVWVDDLVLDDVEGSLRIVDGAARLERLDMGFAAGRMTMSGVYAAPTADEALIDFTIDTVRFDVGEVMASIQTLERIAPIARGVSGTFGSGLSLRTRVLGDLSIDLPALVSTGNLRDLRIVLGPSVLADIASKLGDPALGVPNLAGTRIGWRIEGGKMRLSPMAFKLGGAAATLSGTTSIVDQTLDLVLEVPVSASALSRAGSLPAALARVGTVPVRIRIRGTFADPAFEIEVGDAARAALGEVVELARGQILDQVADLVAAASAEGDRLIAAAEAAAAKLRADAQRAADKLRAEAKKQGDKLVSDAKNPVAKAAAREAATQLQKDADKRANKLTREADSEADGLVTEARRQKEKLVADATRRTDAAR